MSFINDSRCNKKKYATDDLNRIASYEKLKLPPFAVTEFETLSKSTVSLENCLLLSLPSKEKLAV